MSHLLTLQQKGVIVLKNIFNFEQLSNLNKATEKCFNNIETLIKEKGINNVKNYLPSHYNFLPHVTSLNISALNDYDSQIITDILSLIENSLIQQILGETMGENHKVKLDQCWLRKQYAPSNYHNLHQPHRWHQDGALGLKFPLISEDQYVDIPLTNLITLWLPLTDCGVNRPGLQFITKNLEKPLHFNYLKEEILREMFNFEDFFTPKLNIGDGVIFLNGTLHQTYVNSMMKNDRMSIEFRFFL